MIRSRTAFLCLALAAGSAGLTSPGLAQADAKADVIAAFRSAMADGTYRMNIVVDNKRGPISTQMDVQMPNRFHMKAAEVEFIVVPEGTWINAGGRWMKVPVDMSERMQGFRIEDMEKASSGIPDVELVGTEDVDGCESSVYRYVATTSVAGRSSEDDVELAICTATGKPIRVRTTPKRKGESVAISYDFDAHIDIRPPQ